jgi:transcriptional regulator with XRE-family HTH domain
MEPFLHNKDKRTGVVGNKFDPYFITSYDHLEWVEREVNFEKSVGQKVRELRKRLGWSQQVLADYANLEKTQIQRVELAKHSAALAILTTIAKALGRQPFELLKTEYHVKVNKDLHTAGRRRTVTTEYIRQIVSGSFLNQPRKVDDVVKFCEEKYDVIVGSSATSASLKKFVDEGVLKRAPSKIKSRFVYQKR